MGRLPQALNRITLQIHNRKIKMAFYIYEQPAFSMEHLHPGFIQPFMTQSRPRYWNVLENVFEKDLKSLKSDQYCCKTKSVEKLEEKSSTSTEEGNKMEEVEIKIQFHGHKFKAENLDVQVINEDILVVKAEDDGEKFERKFKLSSNALVDKIESKFDTKEEGIQTLAINIPKDVKKFQVPISMEE